MKITYSPLSITLIVVAAASVAGSAAPLATEADAALQGVTIREEALKLSPDRPGQINANCGDDEGSLAGGVRWAAGSSLLNNRILTIDPRAPFREGARSTARDYDHGGTDTAISIAICVPDTAVPPIVERTEGGEASGGRVTASCNPGEMAIGGGVFALRLFGVQTIAESRPTDVNDDGVALSWSGRYINDSEPDEPFEVKVLCAEPSDDFTVETATSTPVPLPPGGLAVATAECPRTDQIAIGVASARAGRSVSGWSPPSRSRW